MLDAPQRLLAMSAAVRDGAMSDPGRLAESLRLDLSLATVTMTKAGTFAIAGARTKDDGNIVGVISVLEPTRILYVIPDSKSEPFVASQFQEIGSGAKRLESKYASGFTLSLSIDGVTCGVTVSREDGMISSRSCEAPVEPKLSSIPSDV